MVEEGSKSGWLGIEGDPTGAAKIRFTAGDASNQVVLEGLYSALSRVFSVQVGRYKL